MKKPERQDDLRQIDQWLPSALSGQRLLEVACGTGYRTQFLAPAATSIGLTPDTATRARVCLFDMARGPGAILPASVEEPTMHLRLTAVAACLLIPITSGNAAVTLNGAALPHADARPDVTVAIVEIREGGDPVIRLAPGVKRYGVSVATKSPIPALEAELPISSTAARFTVGADGRTFRNCVVASLSTDSKDGQQLVYALRCEDVTVP